MKIEIKEDRINFEAENEPERSQIKEIVRDLDMRSFDHGLYADGRIKSFSLPLNIDPQTLKRLAS